MAAPPRVSGNVGVFPEAIAGGLAYITFVPAVIFLALEPYRKNRFVRFHALQCLLFWATGLLTAGLLRLAALVLALIPVLGPLLIWLLAAVAGLAAFFVWLTLIVKALQGETFKLAVLGDLAERYGTAS